MGVRSIIFRSFRDNVQLGTLLAFVAGNINSIAFIHFGTYVSHVSGHATRSAILYAEGSFTSALLFFFEFLAFIFGAAFTSFLLRGYTAASTQVKYTVPICIEILLILIYYVLVTYSESAKISYIAHSTFLLAVAMGMQNAMLRQASGTFVRTTHITGVATDFGAEFGAAFRLACEGFLTKGLSFWMRFPAAGNAFAERLSVSRFLFHGFILLAFSSGAVLGAIIFLLYKDLALLTPLCVLALIAVREYKRT